jgi:hypothetical protein
MGGYFDSRAYSGGATPYCFLNERVKWLLSKKRQRAASSEMDSGFSERSVQAGLVPDCASVYMT